MIAHIPRPGPETVSRSSPREWAGADTYSVSAVGSGSPIGDIYMLNSYQPPELAATTYTYHTGNGDNTRYQLFRVTTSFGGILEYTFDHHEFGYDVPGEAKGSRWDSNVLRQKKINFGQGVTGTWDYVYPDYLTLAAPTVEVRGPLYNTFVTYYGPVELFDPQDFWKLGLIKKSRLSDDSRVEEYEWESLMVDDASPIAEAPAYFPLRKKVTKAGLPTSLKMVEECFYHTQAAKEWGLPSHIQYSGTGCPSGSSSYTDWLTYAYQGANPDFLQKHMLAYVSNTETKDNGGARLKETGTAFDDDGSVTSVTKWAEGSSWLTWTNTHARSSSGDLITVTTDLPGHKGPEVTTYRYGVLAKREMAGVTELSRNISPYDSSVSDETNRHGGKMELTYDGLGRITDVTMPAGFDSIHASWSTNAVTITRSAGTPRAKTIVKHWDGTGRSYMTKEAGDGISLYDVKELDAEGRVVHEIRRHTDSDINNDSLTYDYTYFASGDVASTRDPAGNSSTINYDGCTRRVVDPRGKTWSYGYGQYPGKIVSVQEPGIASYWNHSYDDLGRLISARSSDGSREQEYTYDGLDRIRTERHPETGLIRYTYDPADGNLKAKEWGNTTTHFTYNAANQVETVGSGDEVVTYRYDTRGRLRQTSSSMDWERQGMGADQGWSGSEGRRVSLEGAE